MPIGMSSTLKIFEKVKKNNRTPSVSTAQAQLSEKKSTPHPFELCACLLVRVCSKNVFNGRVVCPHEGMRPTQNYMQHKVCSS
jgi:hypothetical protein